MFSVFFPPQKPTSPNPNSTRIEAKADVDSYLMILICNFFVCCSFIYIQNRAASIVKYSSENTW